MIGKKRLMGMLGILMACSSCVWASDTMEMDTGTTAWMLTSTAFVLLMVPGLAMFYGGLVRTKNVIGTMMDFICQKE
jgi:ammonium transporter, Amt family